MATEVKCPTCKNLVPWDQSSLYRPFCSERCKLIDFGAWADDSHVISDNPVDDFSTDSSE